MRVVVVGNGLIGSAAGRHLAESGHEVVVIGPDEPEDAESHDGVFASHYDQGRLVSGFSRDPVWAELGRRSVPEYDRLTAATGIDILHRVGRVSAFRATDEERERLRGWAAELDPTGTMLRLCDPSDTSWRAAAPMLSVSDGFDVLVERGDAGYLDPRALIRAQNVAAEGEGARLVRARVDAVTASDAGVEVTVHGREPVVADRAIAATGAYVDTPGLLPESLGVRTKTETTVWAEVTDEVAADLAGMPVITYDVDDDQVDDVYLAPPIHYPDGVSRIKMGANTAHESWPEDVDAIDRWFRSGDSDADLPALEHVLRSMLLQVDLGRVTSHRCIVTYTPSRYPTIDRAPGDDTGRLVVATGGNGTGAQCSDALGALAAGLVADDPWPDALPRSPFAASHEWDEQPRSASRAQRRAFVHGRGAG